MACCLLAHAAETGALQDPPGAPEGAAAAATAKQAPPHLALLIGINEYRDPAIRPLAGCLTDVEAVYSVLVERFGFAADEIFVLADAEATRDGILEALMRLSLRAGPETTVVVHFSGHGSAVRDVDGDEPDGWDETLVPHDSGRGRLENRDISDDELQALIGRLSRKTEKITLIIDAAVGGAAASRGSGRVRAVPADNREPTVMQRILPRFLDVPRGRSAAAGVTRLSAGRSGSAVFEGSFGDASDPITAGVFTYHLTRRLWEVEPRASWEEVFFRVRDEVSAWGGQQPEFAGEPGELVFDTPSRRRQAHFLADPGSRGIFVSGGVLRGLSAGSMLDVFPPGTEDFTAAARTGRIRLRSVDLTTSIGELVEGSVEGRSWAVLSTVRYAESKVRLRLETTEGSELTRELEALLRANDLIDLVEADYDLLVRETQGELHVEGPSTSPWRSVIPLDGERDAATAILQQVNRRAQWLSLLELRNPSPAFEVELELWSADAGPQARSGPLQVREGERYSMRVTNLHADPLYPVVLVLSAYDQSQVIHPPSMWPEAVAPGAAVELELTATIEAGLTSTRDLIKVIASTEPIGGLDLSPGASRGAAAPNTFAQLFDYRARGSLGETSVDPRTWAVASASVEVLRGFVLWVDDQPENNEFLRQRLRRQGWQTILARSTAEALERLEDRRFDVVISDFSRPRDDRDGYGLLKELESRGGPPLVYYVANFTAEQAEDARRQGALGETNDAQELLRLVERARRRQ